MSEGAKLDDREPYAIQIERLTRERDIAVLRTEKAERAVQAERVERLRQRMFDRETIDHLRAVIHAHPEMHELEHYKARAEKAERELATERHRAERLADACVDEYSAGQWKCAVCLLTWIGPPEHPPDDPNHCVVAEHAAARRRGLP